MPSLQKLVTEISKNRNQHSSFNNLGFTSLPEPPQVLTVVSRNQSPELKVKMQKGITTGHCIPFNCTVPCFLWTDLGFYVL